MTPSEQAPRGMRAFTIVWLGQLPEAPALLDPDGPSWATIDTEEPALMAGADSVATRLLGPTSHRNSTLHRFG